MATPLDSSAFACRMETSNRDTDPNPHLPTSANRDEAQHDSAGGDWGFPVPVSPGPPPRPSPPAPIDGYDPNKVYGVTRRFSLATLMLMMAATSLLLAVMNVMKVPAYVTGAIILLSIATATGQMFLLGGKDPRRASLIVGVVCCPLLAVFVLEVGNENRFRRPEPVEIIAVTFTGLLFGAPLGYSAGCVVAGVLLLMDLTESKLVRWRRVRQPDDDPWPPPRPERPTLLPGASPPSATEPRLTAGP